MFQAKFFGLALAIILAIEIGPSNGHTIVKRFIRNMTDLPHCSEACNLHLEEYKLQISNLSSVEEINNQCSAHKALDNCLEKRCGSIYKIGWFDEEQKELFISDLRLKYAAIELGCKDPRTFLELGDCMEGHAKKCLKDNVPSSVDLDLRDEDDEEIDKQCKEIQQSLRCEISVLHFDAKCPKKAIDLWLNMKRHYMHSYFLIKNRSEIPINCKAVYEFMGRVTSKRLNLTTSCEYPS